VRLRLLLLAFLSFSAHAADYRSVGDEGGILYDAPSREATPLYVVSKDYPLEVLVHLEAWTKVRDHTGALSWIETRSLGERHTVMVTAATVEAHERPEEGAPVRFVAVQDVALELIDTAPAGWLHVRHAEGGEGYLQSSAVWGE
jgi:SH3-like domain-containing protein